jgi:hypothetical protein
VHKSVLIFGAPDSVGVHRTLPVPQASQQMNRPLLGILQARSIIIHRTVRCATGLSGEPTEQWLPARQRLFRQMNSAATEVRGHRTVRCSKTTRRFNGQLLQTLTDALTWRAPDNEQ